MNRRKYLKYTGAAVAAAVAAAAGYGIYESTKPAPVVTPTSALATTATTTAPTGLPAGKRSLTVATMSVTLAMPWLSTSPIPGYGAQYWAKDHGVELKVVEIPIGSLYDKIMLELMAGTGAFDIIAYPSYWAGDIMGGGYVKNLDSYIEKYRNDAELAYDDYMDVYRERLNKWAGHTYGLQIDGDVWVLFYRKDIMEKPENQAKFKKEYGYDLAPPKTWEEYRDIAKFFNGWDWDGDGEVEYGCSEITNRSGAYMIWNFWTRYDPAVIPPGGKPGAVYFDPETMKPLINSPPGKKALENWVECLKYAPPGSQDFTYEQTWDSFLGGMTFMTHQWPDLGPLGNDPKYSKIVGKEGYARVPGWKEAYDFEKGEWVKGGTGGYWIDGVHYGAPLAWGWTAAIVNTCKDPDLAFDLIKFVVSPAQAYLQAAEAYDGLDPYRKSVFALSPDVVKALNQVLPGWKNYDEFFRALKDAIDVGVPDLRIPGAYAFYETLCVHLSNVFVGRERITDALGIAESEWEFRVEEKGKEFMQKMYLESLG